MTKRLSDAEHIRECPHMYIGDRGFWGAVNYLVLAYDLFVGLKATEIDLEIGDAYQLDSDCQTTIERIETMFGSLAREFGALDQSAYILSVLSKSVTIRHQDVVLRYERAELVGREKLERPVDGLSLELVPDDEIFTILEFPISIVQSYLNRKSYLWPNVRLGLRAAGKQWEYHSPDGIREMFKGMCGPFQILHDPFYFSGKQDNFEMEFVFALHSWSRNYLTSFANGGRVVEGGTHEEGMSLALEEFRSSVFEAENPIMNPGWIALMNFEYPKIEYSGCIKTSVLSEEVKTLTYDLASQWLGNIDIGALKYLLTTGRFRAITDA